MNTQINKLRLFAMSRRHFLRASAIAGGLTAAGTLAPSYVTGLALSTAAAQDDESDLGVLQFALGLEHLETQLYRDIDTSRVLEGDAREFAEVFARDEAEHVDALSDTISALGGEPVKPLETYNFPRVTTQQEALDLLADVEDVGVSAYLGAATLFQDPQILRTALTIHNVEAAHATGVRLVGGKEALGEALGQPRTQEEVLQIVSPFGYGDLPDTGAGGAVSPDRGPDGVTYLAGLGVAATGVAIARRRLARTE